jgi:uncharacterized protein YndB with AHSA1/START domain
MGTFRVTIDINRPAADVFAFVAEPRNMPRWYEAVERVVEVTPRTPRQAASYEITRSLPGGRTDNIVDVTESTLNLTVTFESRDGPTPFRYRYAIEPNGEGSLLTLDADISSAGLPGPLAHLDAVATRAFKQGMRHNLEGLKHLVESTAAEHLHERAVMPPPTR